MKPAPKARRNLVLTAALDYAKRGWRVFPILAVTTTGECSCGNAECDKPGKHPAIKGWPKEATTDPAQLAEWWGTHPDRGVGIATGKLSNLTVLDVDGPEGAESLGQLQRGVAMPTTPTVQSRPGRYHYYFAYNPAIKTTAKKIGPGLDTRNDGGYVVAPPSVHVETGQPYEWRSKRDFSTPLAEWPAFLDGKPASKGPGRPATKETFNAASLLDVDRVTAALAYVDPDDEERWAQAGWIMGRAFQQSDAGFALYRAWSARSRKFNDKRTKAHYYERSKEPRLDVKTTRAIYEWAVEGGWVEPLPADDHWSLALALLTQMQTEYGTRPVYTQGQFWVTANNLWTPLSVDAVACRTAEWFHTEKFCKRNSDFKGIAQLAAQIVNDDRYFESAAVGVAGPKLLWAVTDGALTKTPLRAEHRMRTRVSAEPDFKRKAPLFSGLLDRSFKDDRPQRELLQLLFGAALVQRLWKYQIAVLLLGRTGSGKSVLLNLLRAMFLTDLVSAVNPQNWGDEYYRAGLAGKALNIVGELDPRDPLSGGAFKEVTGEDLISGRHPTHRPFYFVSQAAQLFNGNRLPPTNDRDDAFYRRWRIVHFKNTVPVPERDQDLAAKIIAQEIDAVLAWMLKGAERASNLQGGFPETAEHLLWMEKWRNANNSALLFVNDTSVCVRDWGGKPTTGNVLYRAYGRWAQENGLRAFGRNNFFEALEEGGLTRVEVDHQPAFAGVCVRTPEML